MLVIMIKAIKTNNKLVTLFMTGKNLNCYYMFKYFLFIKYNYLKIILSYKFNNVKH